MIKNSFRPFIHISPGTEFLFFAQYFLQFATIGLVFWRVPNNSPNSFSRWRAPRKKCSCIALPFSKGSYLMQGFIFVPIIKWDFFVFSKLTKKNTFCIKFCQWLDSNCRSLVLEQTALPIELQPLPYKYWHSGELDMASKFYCMGQWLWLSR